MTRVRGKCQVGDCGRQGKTEHSCITCEKLHAKDASREVFSRKACRWHGEAALSEVKRHALTKHPANLLGALCGAAQRRGRTLMKDMTVKEGWESFFRDVVSSVSPGVSNTKNYEKTFYAGAFWVIKIVNQISHAGDFTDEQRWAIMGAMLDEIQRMDGVAH